MNKSLFKESDVIERFESEIEDLVDAKKKKDKDKVVEEHEKIDRDLHAFVGEEGLRPEEKEAKKSVAGFPVGTIKVWKDEKYLKSADGVWEKMK